MSVAKTVLIGGIGFGLAAWFLHSKANAASSAGTLPPNWKPPANATVTIVATPTSLGSGLRSLKQTSWHVPADASGQQAGTFRLTQNVDDPNDWAVAFQNDASGSFGLIAYSQTPNGGLMAQAVAAGQ